MNRHSFGYPLAAILLCTSACTNESILSDDSQSEAQNQKTIEVVMPPISRGNGAGNTRTDFGSDFTVTWGANDTLGIFPDKGNQVYFALKSGSGNLTATFTGGAWGLKGSNAYDAYYPFNRSSFASEEMRSRIPVSVAGQWQDGPNSMKHLSHFDYMAAKGQNLSSGKIDLPMEHLVTFLKLNITLPISGKLEYIGLWLDKGKGDIMPLSEEGSIDLNASKPAIAPDYRMADNVLGCKNFNVTANQSFSAYLAALPVLDLGQSSVHFLLKINSISI